MWWQQPCPGLDLSLVESARQRQRQLTKPTGSLGRLEQLAVELAGLQQRPLPAVDRVNISIFAADHGVVAEGISAYPQQVTGQMLGNFLRGGAAISVLARQLGANLHVLDLGLAHPLALEGLERLALGPGTQNFTEQPAMTEAQAEAALAAGKRALDRAVAEGDQLFLGGEMGIGNTTAASALACALLALEVEQLVGPGTGLDDAGVRRKAEVIRRGLARHAAALQSPWQALCCLGGFEIAALTGAYIRAGQLRVPVLVDGFICSVAALLAVRLNPSCRANLLFAHQGAEPGHRHVLSALQAEPLLHLQLRLGEASGAALAVPLLRMACAIHAGMATFEEAAVSGEGS